MRVLMQGRYGLLSAKGGDRVQIENTADCLRSMGVSVDIVDSDVSDISSYDIVHVFQLDWTPETHFFVKHAKAQGKKVILSPIHHNIAEVKKFDDICVYDYRRISKYLFRDQHSRDTFKNVYRSIFTPKKLWPTVYSVFAGLKNMHIETLKMCDTVLVQTDLEASDLISTYAVNIKWVKVPNGVGEQFLQFGSLDNPFDFSDYIFCGGRIEPRKNQLNLIQAVAKFRQENNLDTKLVLAGNPSTFNHLEYTYRFKKALVDNPWVVHVNHIPYDQMPAYFSFAKVCVSASWFETTGLTLLEALFCKTNAVSTSPRAKEILGDYASYCSPEDIDSIARAIKLEYFKERPVIAPTMRQEYTWQNAASKTLRVYRELLS